jgi:nucleoside 2-deoxyribosyltransferase
MTTLLIYLAGPDVFLPDAWTFAEAKRELCGKHGFMGMSPVDNEIDVSMLSKHEAVLSIAWANESAIRKCNLLIANLTPFRGLSADVGTAYEVGFARALGLPVFGYTNVAGNLLERAQKARASGTIEDSDGMAIEDFDSFDNLMLVGALEAPAVVNAVSYNSRFTDLRGFEACLRQAAAHFGIEKKVTNRRLA